MKEIWKSIENFNRYSVSNLGNIKNSNTNKILKGDRNLYGHLRVSLFSHKMGRKRFFSHRLVAIAFVKNPNNYPVVNHLNCNPSDNRSSNLEWTDVKGNTIHARDN